MTTLEILKAARELISVPERWTQRSYARAADESSRSYNDGEACKWCVMGAIGKVSRYADHEYTSDTVSAALSAIDALRKLGGCSFSVAEFNDATSTTHADVLCMFDRAIARLSQTEDAGG